MPVRRRKTSVRKRPVRRRRGKGIFGDILKGGTKILAPVLVDALGQLIKNKVSGLGRRRRRAGRSVKPVGRR